MNPLNPSSDEDSSLEDDNVAVVVVQDDDIEGQKQVAEEKKKPKQLKWNVQGVSAEKVFSYVFLVFEVSLVAKLLLRMSEEGNLENASEALLRLEPILLFCVMLHHVFGVIIDILVERTGKGKKINWMSDTYVVPVFMCLYLASIIMLFPESTSDERNKWDEFMKSVNINYSVIQFLGLWLVPRYFMAKDSIRDVKRVMKEKVTYLPSKHHEMVVVVIYLVLSGCYVLTLFLLSGLTDIEVYPWQPRFDPETGESSGMSVAAWMLLFSFIPPLMIHVLGELFMRIVVKYYLPSFYYRVEQPRYEFVEELIEDPPEIESDHEKEGDKEEKKD